jgi:SAM-dependent methyltransferase
MCRDLLQANHISEERCRVLQGDAIQLPFAANAFDLVLSLDSAYHYDTRNKFIQEAGRCLVSGGRLALGDICLSREVESWYGRLVLWVSRKDM